MAGSKALKIYIQHGSGPNMFSAAMTPANDAAVLEAIRLLEEDATIMARLRTNSARLKDGLTGASTTPPVFPLLLG